MTARVQLHAKDAESEISTNTWNFSTLRRTRLKITSVDDDCYIPGTEEPYRVPFQGEFFWF